MRLETYIDRVKNTHKNIFCKLSISDKFCWELLWSLCDLRLDQRRLSTAWSLIIDAISDRDMDNKIPTGVIEFLINNNICLKDIGHLKISNKFLEEIYKKDNSCWEAKLNIKPKY